MTMKLDKKEDIKNAKLLLLLGDSTTTDHISPAGSIKGDSPAGVYLKQHNVDRADFNSYGSRRGNHEVMMRGTFANIRIKNLMLSSGIEGGYSSYKGEEMSVFDAAMKHKEDGTQLVVIGGKEYGTGSSRDWAAKGTILLGVKAVLCESFERIHRSNLIGMGVLPLQFKNDESAKTHNITGEEEFSISGINDQKPGQDVDVEVKRANGDTFTVKAQSRIDTGDELEYYNHGGILQKVLRDLN
jgi:aconitate hydratase